MNGWGERRRLEATRRSLTHRAKIHTADGPVKFFITVGLYPDGRPGEVYLTFDQSGSTLDGFADAWATALSLCLQRGESIENLVRKFSYQEFEPKGRCGEDGIGYARSVVDYTARWLEKQFVPAAADAARGVKP